MTTSLISRWRNGCDLLMGGHRCGHMTIDLFEGINSSLKGTRHFPINFIVNLTYYQLATIFATLRKESMD
ncbi:hypothetical protein GQ457_08G026300 [Hibiscus cannabinus]